MTDTGKDTMGDDQKVKNIIQLINELKYDMKSLETIKDHCIDLQDIDVSEKKTKYLKQELKEFTKYQELNDLIQGLTVINLKYNNDDNIGRMGEETYFGYRMNLNNVVELEYNYSFTFGGISTLYYRIFGSYSHQCDITMYGGAMKDMKETMTLLDLSLDDCYKALKLKNTSKELLKDFFLVFMEKIKYHPDKPYYES